MANPTDFSHVRWIAGGTGAGKSTVTRLLADRYRVAVFDGDAAEANYVRRIDEHRQPRTSALVRMPIAERWAGRTAEEVFETMPSRHGETFPFVLDCAPWQGRGRSSPTTSAPGRPRSPRC
jgi:hypothetical protein